MIVQWEKDSSGAGTDGDDEGHASAYRRWRSKQVWGETCRGTHAPYKTKMRKPHGDPVSVSEKAKKNNSLMLSSSVGNPEKSRRLISSREHRGHHIHYSKQRIRMAPPHGHCSSDLRVDWEVELASCQGFFLTIRLSRCLLKNTFLMSDGRWPL